MNVFAARYSSICWECNEGIEEGDVVTYGGTSVIHAACSDDSAPERDLLVCGGCHLTQPCGCEDD